MDTIGGRSKTLWNRKHKRIMIVSTILFVLIFCIVRVFLETPIVSAETDYMPHSSYPARDNGDIFTKHTPAYNYTYPLTQPVSTNTGVVFRFGIITDMDEDSKVTDRKNTWQSFLRVGTLSYDKRLQKVSINWDSSDDKPTALYSAFSNGGRGMELSDLLVFNGRLYSIDDRTGIVYEIENNKKIFPWVILSDGNGHEIKGFKGEWMIRKGEEMIIGGIGKEWTTPNGVVLHHNPQWIKIIQPDGRIRHENWTRIYVAMQEAAGYKAPGYVIHESAAWSDVHQSWFFLPRRASHEKYNDVVDEERGTNLLLKCAENFEKIEITRIGELDDRTKGFSSFKFLPGTRDTVIVALKTYEFKGKTKSFMTSFTIDGIILMPDTLISSDYKYEGFEFL